MMSKLISIAARGAQILLLGFLASLSLAVIRTWPRLSEVGAPAFYKIGVIAAPAILLLIFVQKRRTRLLATLIVYACTAALLYQTEWFLALLGV